MTETSIRTATQQVLNDQASNVMSAQNTDDREARVAHGVEHESLIRLGRQPCRPGITVNRPRAVLRCCVDRKVKSQIQVVHAVEDQRLALSQTQAPSLGHHRILGQEIQRGGMMLLADFPQMAVAGKHLSAAQYGSRPRNGVVMSRNSVASSRNGVVTPRNAIVSDDNGVVSSRNGVATACNGVSTSRDGK